MARMNTYAFFCAFALRRIGCSSCWVQGGGGVAQGAQGSGVQKVGCCTQGNGLSTEAADLSYCFGLPCMQTGLGTVSYCVKAHVKIHRVKVHYVKAHHVKAGLHDKV